MSNVKSHSTLRGYTAIGGVVALIAGVAAGILFALFPALVDTARVLLGVALLFFVLFVIGAFDEVRSALLARQTKYGTNAFVMVLAFAAIMVVINVLAAQVPQRLDLTAGGQFTLSQHTQNVLHGLSQPVTVTGFFIADAPEAAFQKDQAEALLREYQNVSSQVSYSFVDPVENPTVARQYQIQGSGLLVFEQAGRRQVVAAITEQDFTGGILKVLGTERLKLYFLTGHGEHDFSASDEQGYLLVAQTLDAENYEINPLDLDSTPQVPSNASLVIVASPQRPMLDAAARALDTYLVNGGKALFLLDPNPRPEITALLQKWGVKVAPGQVVDPGATVQNLPNGVVIRRNQYLSGQITQSLDATVFPGTAGLTIDIPQNDTDHVVALPLGLTSPGAFATNDSNRTSFDANLDVRGPFALALTVQADRPVGQQPSRPGSQANLPTRIGVFGDSDFAANRYFYSVSNSDLLINTVNWLTAQEELISIRPKPPAARRLVITGSQWTLIVAASVVFWPSLMLMAGAAVWWRRR